MTLKFHTLEHIGVCCLLRRNLAKPRLRSLSNSHSFFSKMNEAGFKSWAAQHPEAMLAKVRVGHKKKGVAV
jgi:hypothetical protein